MTFLFSIFFNTLTSRTLIVTLCSGVVKKSNTFFFLYLRIARLQSVYETKKTGKIDYLFCIKPINVILYKHPND